MDYIIRFILCGVFVFATTSAFAGSAEDADAVIDRWAAAFNTNDVDVFIDLYTLDALLQGLLSPKPYEGRKAIGEYFKVVHGMSGKVMINARHIAMLCDKAAIGAGLYQFELMQNGQRVPRPARFTFVIVKREGKWLIAHDHSSILPPAPLQ